MMVDSVKIIINRQFYQNNSTSINLIRQTFMIMIKKMMNNMISNINNNNIFTNFKISFNKKMICCKMMALIFNKNNNSNRIMINFNKNLNIFMITKKIMSRKIIKL